jgi:hypothetical protein
VVDAALTRRGIGSGPQKYGADSLVILGVGGDGVGSVAESGAGGEPVVGPVVVGGHVRGAGVRADIAGEDGDPGLVETGDDLGTHEQLVDVVVVTCPADRGVGVGGAVRVWSSTSFSTRVRHGASTRTVSGTASGAPAMWSSAGTRGDLPQPASSAPDDNHANNTNTSSNRRIA